MSRHLRLIAVCAGLLAGVGCSREHRLPTEPTPSGPTAPTGPDAPPPLPAAQRLAALTLFDAAFVHEALTTSPLKFASWDGQVIWSNGPCMNHINGQPESYGSLRGTLDGSSSPTAGTFLPTGSHTYVVSFSDCQVDDLSGVELNGVASAAYRAADWSNLAATVAADSLRGRGLGLLSYLDDVTADGSAVWTSVGSNRHTTTYTPATGSGWSTIRRATWPHLEAVPTRSSHTHPRKAAETAGNTDLTISRSPLTAPSTHLAGASRLYSDSGSARSTPARFESSMMERRRRVFTATSATL